MNLVAQTTVWRQDLPYSHSLIQHTSEQSFASSSFQTIGKPLCFLFPALGCRVPGWLHQPSLCLPHGHWCCVEHSVENHPVILPPTASGGSGPSCRLPTSSHLGISYVTVSSLWVGSVCCVLFCVFSTWPRWTQEAFSNWGYKPVNKHTWFVRSLAALRASLVAQVVKHLPAMGETWVWSLGWEDPLEQGMATHSSILAWRIPWTEEPGGLQFMGSQSQSRLNNFHFQKKQWYRIVSR